MKFLFKHQSVDKKVNDACMVTEHPIGDEMINIAIARVTGRYPTTGYARNNKSKEIGYIFEGSGKLVVNDTEQLLQRGDVVLIEPGEKFYWEGHMGIYLSCTPAWTPGQNEMVDN